MFLSEENLPGLIIELFILKKKKPFHLQNIKQGKGYMKTYWLKGKKDLSFKTPAELRYSSEQKDSEDKSSNE